MFNAGILIGIYSYIIFFVGLLGYINKLNILVITLFFLIFSLFIYRRSIFEHLRDFRRPENKKGILFILIFILIIIQGVVNFIGALGPELAFDALWYHLTIPKIWLDNESIFYIPGGLLYYSAMPKLAEMLYIAGLAFGDDITVKIIHFSFGILTMLCVYFLTGRFFNKTIALCAAAIFYSNPVVAWESITAYVDLARAFYEILALWAFVLWADKKDNKWLFMSALFTGFAISTKLLAVGSIFIFCILIAIVILKDKDKSIYLSIKRKFGVLTQSITSFILIALLVPLPWMIFSYNNTGTPFFPFFTDIYPIQAEPTALNNILSDVLSLLLYAPDPLSPIYFIFLPLIIIYYRYFPKNVKLILVYSVLALIVWYFTPRTGGGRFIVSYLPAMSIAAAGCLYIFTTVKQFKTQMMSRVLFGTIIAALLICIVYRGGANSKYLPVLTGAQTKSEFLEKNLVFSFGDFYDIDNFFKNNIKDKDRVLLIGFHNLYYVDFPYVHETWVTEQDNYNFVAIQNGELPDKYKNWKAIYENKKTGVKLYSK